MDKRYIMALDQGTTSSRCIIFDKTGAVVSRAQREVKQIYPRAGWVEQNPNDILATQMGVISEALTLHSIQSKQIAAIGITNQRESTVVWNKHTGRPIYNAIIWQCRRTAGYCETLKEQNKDKQIYDKTGLVVDAYFSATKLKWILDNVKGAREAASKGELLFGTIDTFLLWHLTRGRLHATDYTNASRTMFYNIHTLSWDDELLKFFDIPKSILPAVMPSGADYGYADESLLGAKIPISGILGDQQAALFGQLCVNKGDIKNTYGTGCFMLMNTGERAVRSKNGLVTTLIAGTTEKPLYALEGSVFVGGAVVQWLRDELRMFHDAVSSEAYAVRVEDTNGVYIVPAFVGLGAPYWDSDARGTVVGITRGVKKEHFVRAGLEAIAYQTGDVLLAMQNDCNSRITTLNVDGGAAQNDFLMQFQADISGIEVVRPRVLETTALGACYMAGLSAGYFKDLDEIKANYVEDKRFLPCMEEGRRKSLYEGWLDAVYKTQVKRPSR